MKPKARNDLGIFEVDDEFVVYDPHTARAHHLNPTGGLVLRLCDGSATMAQTASEIAEIYDMAAEDVEPQVRAVVRDLRKAGLLMQKPPPRRKPPAPEVVLVKPEHEPAEETEPRRAEETELPPTGAQSTDEAQLTSEPELDHEHADGRKRVRMQVPRST